MVDCKLLGMRPLARSGPATGHQYAKKRRRSLPLLAGALWLGGAAACAVGVQEELQLGDQYAAEGDKSMPVVHDAAVQGPLDAELQLPIGRAHVWTPVTSLS